MKHFCPFKTDKSDWPIERSYTKHMELLTKGKECKGCIRKPSIPFDCQQFPPDMLHLKKRNNFKIGQPIS